MFCPKCGKEISDLAVICVNCGTAIEQESVTTTAVANVEDKPSIGLCILAFLIPLFGFIYWPVKHKETPKKAKACGIVAIIGWAISFVINMINMTGGNY